MAAHSFENVIPSITEFSFILSGHIYRHLFAAIKLIECEQYLVVLQLLRV